MEGQFKVGEVLVGQHFVRDTYRNGQECTVIGKLKIRSWYMPKTGEIRSGVTYFVRWSDGHENCAWPEKLRRKQPPSGEQSILAMFKVSPPKRIGEPA